MKKGWSETTLGELCDLRKEQCDPSQVDDGIYVGLEHIDPGRFFLERHGSPSDVRSAKSRFYPGDVLYGKLRPYLDKAVVADQEGICSTDILVLTPKSCPSWFLCGVLHTKNFIEHANQTTHGVNHPRTSWANIRPYQVLDIPLPEQERIAGILMKIQGAIRLQDRIIQTLRDLKKSTLRHLFTHGTRGEKTKMTEIGEMPESWEVVKLGEVFETQLGKMLSQKARVGDDPRPYLRNKNVQWGRIDLSDMLCMDFSERERRKFLLRPGDLLICEGGEPGRAAIWSGDIKECYYQKALHRLRPKDERGSNCFLALWLTYAFQSQNLYGIAGASSTIAHLPEIQLKQLPIPIAPAVEQYEITRVLNDLSSRVMAHENRKSLYQDMFSSTLGFLYAEGGGW